MASPPLPMYPPPISMTGIEHPTNHDVKSGRGVSTNSWPGNERFRSLVNCNKELYVTSTKRQKMSISRSIVEAVRSLDPPGRFLEKNPETGLWSDIGDKKAIEKTSQALRDGAAALRKQLSADMNDPDFLSAVFDSSAPIPEGPPKKSGKKGKPPAKGHRRVKSNPTVGTATRTKALLKKARSGETVPLSPKSSLNLPVIPRPPQSPMSPGSSGRGSPGMEMKRSPNQDPFRRPPEHGAYPGSPPVYGLPARSASFDYHDLDRGGYCDSPRRPERSPPMQYGHYSSPPSPSGYGAYNLPPPYPMPSPRGHHMPPSPRGGPMSPLPPGRHHLSPSGYRKGPASPAVAWSPRQFDHSPGQSLSPHPYLHPLDTPPSYRSPEHRPFLSPRMQYNHDPGRISPGLAVPTLGGERNSHAHSPPSPMWREPNPYYSPRSPREAQQPAGHPEFMPPPPTPPSHRHRSDRSPDYRYASPRRILKPTRYSDEVESRGHHPGESYEHPQPSRSESYDETRERRGDPQDYEYRREPEQQPSSDSADPLRESRSSHPTPSPPINVKIDDSFDSPNGIADLGPDDMPMDEGFEVTLPDIEQKRSRDSSEEFPFDEDNPAAEDDIRMSPLPFDGREDPTTLMELPENLLKLPISPVGPGDDSS